MRERVMDNLPRVFVTAYILTAVAAFFITATAAENAFIIGVYGVYAFGGSVIALGMLLLALKSEDGLVSRWFACFLYEGMFFALTLLCIFVLVNIRLAYPHAPPEDLLLLRRISYAFLTGSATGTFLSAAVFAHGWVHGGLEQKICPWPWPHRCGAKKGRGRL